MAAPGDRCATHCGTLPAPQGGPTSPQRLDRDYDGRGGVFVSFRRRDSDYRVARDGFWHFVPQDADTCRDLVLATVQTVVAARGEISLESLPSLKINATFFSTLEKVPPSRLNFWTHGIVVRSRQFDFKMGGALPTPSIFQTRLSNTARARNQCSHWSLRAARRLPPLPDQVRGARAVVASLWLSVQ